MLSGDVAITGDSAQPLTQAPVALLQRSSHSSRLRPLKFKFIDHGAAATAVPKRKRLAVLPPPTPPPPPPPPQKKIRYKFSAFFVTPTLPALSRVPPAVCPSLLESVTTDSVCTSFLQSLSAYVHTAIPHMYILPFCNLFPHTYIRRFHIRTYAEASFHITIQARSTNTRFTYVQSSTLFRSLNLAFVY